MCVSACVCVCLLYSCKYIYKSSSIKVVRYALLFCIWFVPTHLRYDRNINSVESSDPLPVILCIHLTYKSQQRQSFSQKIRSKHMENNLSLCNVIRCRTINTVPVKRVTRFSSSPVLYQFLFDRPPPRPKKIESKVYFDGI